jgi:hypothetical protein
MEYRAGGARDDMLTINLLSNETVEKAGVFTRVNLQPIITHHDWTDALC